MSTMPVDGGSRRERQGALESELLARNTFNMIMYGAVLFLVASFMVLFA